MSSLNRDSDCQENIFLNRFVDVKLWQHSLKGENCQQPKQTMLTLKSPATGATEAVNMYTFI